MQIASPYERIQQLIFISDKVKEKQLILDFLSRNLDPTGELCAAGWSFSNEDGLILSHGVSGLSINLDPKIQIRVTDDNVLSESLRTGKTKLFAMESMFTDYLDATQGNLYTFYKTGLVLPIDECQIIALAFVSNFETLEAYKEYFEVVKTIIAAWNKKITYQNSKDVNSVKFYSKQLTSRQEKILQMIKDGLTNDQIADSLDFSSSLIRQETMIIYKKLGVSGRKEIL